MRSSYRLSTTIAGLVLLSAGCANTVVTPTPSPPAKCPPVVTSGAKKSLVIHVPETPDDGPTGSLGSNGLTPAMYHAHKVQLTELMRQKLPATTPPWVDELVGDITLKTQPSQGRLLIQDAIGCALRSTESWQGFSGQGLLQLSADWTQFGLSSLDMDAVHTCLIARLNAFGIPVKIWLRGEDVPGGTPAPSYSEAVWLAHVLDPEGDVNLVFDVWPSHELHTSCNDDPAALARAINLRICGDANNPCGVQVHGAPKDNGCTQDKARQEWSCTPTAATAGAKPEPAIETGLGANDWQAIYGCSACSLPPRR